jgi:hypothetical protein
MYVVERRGRFYVVASLAAQQQQQQLLQPLPNPLPLPLLQTQLASTTKWYYCTLQSIVGGQICERQQLHVADRGRARQLAQGDFRNFYYCIQVKFTFCCSDNLPPSVHSTAVASESPLGLHCYNPKSWLKR